MKCETCKKEVSKYARVCENCGALLKIEAKKLTAKDSKNYKSRVACISLAIVMLISIVGVRYIITRSVRLGSSPILYTTRNHLICYDEKTKSEKVLATGSFHNYLMSEGEFSDETVKMESMYYITQDEKKMVYRGNDTVSENVMDSQGVASYDLYQIELTNKAKPVLIASDVLYHKVLTDEYVVYQSQDIFSGIHLYNIETKQETSHKLGTDLHLSQDGNYALQVTSTLEREMVLYSFPELDKIKVLEEENVMGAKVTPDLSKIVYVNGLRELHLVTDLEHNELIAENVSNFTVDFSKQEIEIYYTVWESITNAYDDFEDNFLEHDIQLSKPVLKDGQLEEDPEYVAVMEAYEEKVDRDTLREELKDIEWDFSVSTLYQYRDGKHTKIMDNITIGDGEGARAIDDIFVPYCTGTNYNKLEIDWSKSATDLFDQLISYYESGQEQPNTYLIGDNGLVDLGKYHVMNMDSEEKYLSIVNYSKCGNTQSLGEIKQVSYDVDSLGKEMIVRDTLSRDYTFDFMKANGMVIRSNGDAPAIYYGSGDSDIALDGYIAGSCKIASKDKTLYYLAEGRDGVALYQLDEESEEPVRIAEQVVAFQPISKTEVIVLCQEEGSEEGTVYRFSGPMVKEEIANNVTTLPGYMLE